MKKIDKAKVEQFLGKNARALDLASYDLHFRDGKTTNVMDEIAKYQNEDGGFGNAIEADMRLPKSTALATWMAFQFIKETDVDSGHDVVQKALKYFVDTYDEGRKGWAIVRPEVDEYPHAPWWEYKEAMKHFGWGNPSAEILGLLVKYKAVGADSIIESLKEVALQRVKEVDPNSFHEVFNFKALHGMVDGDFKSVLEAPVRELIEKAVTTDPSKWKDYVATPLKFIESPDDPFADLFDEALIQKNLDFIESQIVDGDHWEPNWSWSGKYPEEWEKAKIEWSGHLTVKNMIILKNFGAL